MFMKVNNREGSSPTVSAGIWLGNFPVRISSEKLSVDGHKRFDTHAAGLCTKMGANVNGWIDPSIFAY